MLWLILIFIIVPAIEIGIFLWTSAEVDVLPVLFMIVFTGEAGVALVREEGHETSQKAQSAIYNNERLGEEMLDGVLPVLFMIVFTGVAGVELVRKEGKETWQKAQLAIYNNERPGEEILDGICIIISGACLLTPGFFTDIIGLLLVIPFTRRPFK